MLKVVKNEKSDSILAAEAKEALHEYIVVAKELMKRGVTIGFSLSNGADGGAIKLQNFAVTKRIMLPGEALPDVPEEVHEGQA